MFAELESSVVLLGLEMGEAAAVASAELTDTNEDAEKATKLSESEKPANNEDAKGVGGVEEAVKSDGAVDESQMNGGNRSDGPEEVVPSESTSKPEAEIGDPKETVLQGLQSMWEFPAAWRLLHIFSLAGLNISEVQPAALEEYLMNADENLGVLEEIHARILGLGPASFNRWINKVKSIARSNPTSFSFLFNPDRVSLARPSARAAYGFEELDDGLRFKDLRTYVKLDAELRCKILHALLEKQLSELDGRVGEEVRSLDSDVLRLLPYGYDADMTTYWYFGDHSRLYREPDLDYQEKMRRQKEREERRSKNAEERERKRKRSTPSRRVSTRRRTRASMASEQDEEEGALDLEVRDRSEFSEGERAEIAEEDKASATDAQDRVPCSKWELVADGVGSLLEFVDSLGNVKNPTEKSLVNRLTSELKVEWEEVRRRANREREKQDRVIATEIEQHHAYGKRSARISALEKKREEERQVQRSMREQEEELEEERHQRRSVLQQAERARDRELKYLRRAKSTTGVLPTAASMRPQRESSRRLTNYRDGGEVNMALLEAQFSARTSRIVPEGDLENIEEYAHSYDNETPNRVLDRFRFIGARGETAKLEYLDKNPDTAIVAEGILVPPSWSDSLPQMIEIHRVTEWCIDYGSDPSLWVKSALGAWYRLQRPANDYRWAFGSTRRRFEISSRLFILNTEMHASDLTYRTVIDLLSYQYFHMLSNKESDVLDVAMFVLSQIESADMKNLLKSEFAIRLRSHVLEKKGQSRSAKHHLEKTEPNSEDNQLCAAADASTSESKTERLAVNLHSDGAVDTAKMNPIERKSEQVLVKVPTVASERTAEDSKTVKSRSEQIPLGVILPAQKTVAVVGAFEKGPEVPTITTADAGVHEARSNGGKPSTVPVLTGHTGTDSRLRGKAVMQSSESVANAVTGTKVVPLTLAPSTSTPPVLQENLGPSKPRTESEFPPKATCKSSTGPVTLAAGGVLASSDVTRTTGEAIASHPSGNGSYHPIPSKSPVGGAIAMLVNASQAEAAGPNPAEDETPANTGGYSRVQNHENRAKLANSRSNHGNTPNPGIG
ncbi:hypothetical protein NDN08_006867 [Rhodosorus marinus]|uniref:RFTS domain-containing protein n=1 Tax=Rhodosorus marinus TaxID=101924 RepID=A0AAV8UMF6_9RHOD|nr:hypothetical protein NDN08_006867 [Rhodosorus marinus]